MTVEHDREVAANVLPARLKVSSVLAERPVSESTFDVPVETDQAAIFANPFTGAEDLLYITGKHLYSYSQVDGAVTQVSPGTSPVDGVVVIRHPRGQLFAFTYGWSGETTTISIYVLVADATGRGEWLPSEFTNATLHSQVFALSVQRGNRPGDPAVIFLLTETSAGSAVTVVRSVVTSAHSPQGEGWWVYRATEFPVGAASLSAMQPVCSLEGPFTDSGTVRLWWLSNNVVTEWHLEPDGGHARQLPEPATVLAGRYTSPSGVGLVSFNGSRLWVQQRGGVSGETFASWDVDVTPDAAQVWQDDKGLMHIFSAKAGTVSVLRQVSHSVTAGIWGPVFGHVAFGLRTLATVPIAGSLSGLTFDTDAGAAPKMLEIYRPVGHPAAVLSQDADTTLWSRVPLRASSTTVRTATRYQSTVTVTDAFGGPVADYPVLISAARPALVTVRGQRYLLGPTVPPARVLSDMRGKVPLVMDATDLAGVEIVVEARGFGGTTMVNPASDVHAFLAGTGTLPSHPVALTAPRLRDAVTSTGAFVFPAWHSKTPPRIVPPTPEQVLTWCSELLTAPSGQQAVVGTTAADGPVPDPPTDPTAPTAPTAPTDPTPSWLPAPIQIGDLWEGIAVGHVGVQDVELNLSSRTATIAVPWDTITYAVRTGWTDASSAAHVVEAIFTSLGATMPAVLDWLTWQLDLKAVFTSQKAITAGLGGLSTYLAPVVATATADLKAGWFATQEDAVKAQLATLKSTLRDTVLDPIQRPPLVSTGFLDQLPAMATTPDRLDNPRNSWFIEQLFDLAAIPHPPMEPTSALFDGAPSDDVAHTPPPAPPAPPAPEFAAAGKALNVVLDLFGSSPEGKELVAAWTAFDTAYAGLVDPSDGRTFSRVQVLDLLGFYEKLLVALLAFCDQAVGPITALITTACDCITPALALTGFDKPGVLGPFWTWLLTEGGVALTTPMSIGNLFGVMAASSVTGSFQGVTGTVPFASGKLPFDLSGQESGSTGAYDDAPPGSIDWLPAGRTFKQAGDYPVHPGGQLTMQICWGLSKGADAWMDHLLTWAASGRLPKTPPGEPSWAIGTAVSQLFVHGICELPIFAGAPALTSKASVADQLAWGAYLSRLPLYLADLVCAVALPASGDKPLGDWVLGTMPVEPGHVLTAVLSAVSAGFGIAAHAAGPGNPADLAFLNTQLIALVPGLTSWLRRTSPTPPVTTSAAFATKSFLDADADKAAGGWQTANAAGALLQKISGDLPNGKVGVPYDTDGPVLLRHPSPRWTPLGWSFDVADLPVGLTCAITGDYDDFLQLSGTPTVSGSYEFTVSTAATYEPNIFTSTTFTVAITPA